MRATSLRMFAVFVLLSAALSSSASAQAIKQMPSPASEQSGQPNLFAGTDGRVYLSWIDRLPEKKFALRFSVKERARWSAPRTIAEGKNWFVNWADFPSLVALADGTLAAHWLARSGAGVYSYDVVISRSNDGGKTWSAPVKPHRDGTETEHGFVSMFPADDGSLAAVWLDGREMKGHGGHGGEGHGGGNMTLRYTTFDKDGQPRLESLLDTRACECCQTSAALTSEGPVVVYRDRSDEEIRDIAIARLRKGRWSTPSIIHRDGWKIDGCPVNGPSVAAAGRRVVVAWYTGAGEKFRVQAAFSTDAGASFGAPIQINDGETQGRVGVLMLKDGSALVSYLEKAASGAQVRLRRVWPDGRRGDAIDIAPTVTAKASGFPRIVKAKDSVVVAWVGGTQVLTAELPLPGGN